MLCLCYTNESFIIIEFMKKTEVQAEITLLCCTIIAYMAQGYCNSNHTVPVSRLALALGMMFQVFFLLKNCTVAPSGGKRSSVHCVNIFPASLLLCSVDQSPFSLKHF